MAHSDRCKLFEKLTSDLCPVAIDPVQQIGSNLEQKEKSGGGG